MRVSVIIWLVTGQDSVTHQAPDGSLWPSAILTALREIPGKFNTSPGPPGPPRCPYLVITPPGVKFPEADRRLEAGPGAQAGRAERTIIGQMFWENENSYNILYLEIFANGQIGPTQILSMTILAVSHSNNTVINIYKRVMMVNHTFKNNWQQIPLTLVCVSISSECLFSFHSLDSRAPESFGIYFWVEFTSNANTLWDIHAYF